MGIKVYTRNIRIWTSEGLNQAVNFPQTKEVCTSLDMVIIRSCEFLTMRIGCRAMARIYHVMLSDFSFSMLRVVCC